MIEVKNENIVNIKTASSKGNQQKWLKDDFWYKVDRNGYESLSEYVVSKLLKKSSLNIEEYVDYELEEIKYKKNIYKACISKNFLKPGEKLITLERLHQSIFGYSLTSKLEELVTVKSKMIYLNDFVCENTNIKNFNEYLSKLLVIDAFFLNEDRHMHNIALILDENDEYRCSPIFDNGASLLSDINIDYPMNVNFRELIDEVKSKTLTDDFYEALDVLEPLYGIHILFDFDEKDIDDVLCSQDLYGEDIKKRVKNILLFQKNKMNSYFKN